MSNEERDLGEIFAATWPRLVRSAYVITRDRRLAEDAVQSAFVKAYASWRRVQRADDPVAYLRRIVINAALASERRAFNRLELPVDHLPLYDSYEWEEALVTRTRMWAAIGDLPPRQRAVIVLRYYEDLSEIQIAEVLRCRPGTVKSQSSAALRSLRASLAVGTERDIV